MDARQGDPPFVRHVISATCSLSPENRTGSVPVVGTSLYGYRKLQYRLHAPRSVCVVADFPACLGFAIIVGGGFFRRPIWGSRAASPAVAASRDASVFRTARRMALIVSRDETLRRTIRPRFHSTFRDSCASRAAHSSPSKTQTPATCRMTRVVRQKWLEPRCLGTDGIV